MRSLESSNPQTQKVEWLPGTGGGENGELLFHGYSLEGWKQCEHTEQCWTVHSEMVKMVIFMLCVFYHNLEKKKKPILSKSLPWVPTWVIHSHPDLSKVLCRLMQWNCYHLITYWGAPFHKRDLLRKGWPDSFGLCSHSPQAVACPWPGLSQCLLIT